MDNQWFKINLNDFIEFNPKLSLKKGNVHKKVSMDNLNPFTKKILSFENEEFKGGSKFCNGDTIMARITPCLENGKTSYVDILNEGEIGFGSTEFIVLRAKENISESHFIYYLSTTPFFRDIAIKSMVGTSGRQRVQIDALKNLEILVPSLKEQQKISKILSSLDEKIEINRKMNENLEEQAKEIFKRWFVDYEFPNKEGQPYKSSGGEMVESELGLIPKGWKVKKIAEIIKFIKGKKPKIISDEYFYGSQKYLTIEVLNRISNLYCTGNNIINTSELDNLIVADGAKSGTIYYSQDGIVGSTLFKMELICENISNDYIYFLFKLYENEIKLNKTGSAIPHLDRKYVENILITIPNIEFSNQNIFNFLNYIRLLIIRNSEQIQKLSSLRDTLLPKLMTGEIDVSKIDI